MTITTTMDPSLHVTTDDLNRVEEVIHRVIDLLRDLAAARGAGAPPLTVAVSGHLAIEVGGMGFEDATS